MPYTYDYPRPSLTADCLIFAQDADNDLKILLIERAHPPFQGKWAFPGGFLDENESAESAANRELLEETGVKNVTMTQFHTFSTPGRDPRGWVISVAFYALVNMEDCKPQAADDASKAEWISVSTIQEMAFDHLEMLEMALKLVVK